MTATDSKERIPLDDLVLDDSIMPRIAEDSLSAVEDYAELERRSVLPPLRVVRSPTDKTAWLADGSIRVAAKRRIGQTDAECLVTIGERAEAVWIATGANRHGLPLSKGQKKKAVELVLSVPRFAKQTDTRLADHIGCSLGLVATVRTRMKKELENVNRELATEDTKKEADQEPPTTESNGEVVSEVADLQQETVRWFRDGKLVKEGTEGAIPVKMKASGGRKPSKGKGKGKGGGKPDYLQKNLEKDKAGKPIPDWLKETIKGAVKLDTFCTEIGDWLKRLEEFSTKNEAADLLDIAEVTAGVKLMRSTIQEARFWAVCPSCAAAGKAVKSCVCRGRGWHNRQTYSECVLNTR